MFSLENTIAPAAPALDELVPSRYALKVGDIDVLVVEANMNQDVLNAFATQDVRIVCA